MKWFVGVLVLIGVVLAAFVWRMIPMAVAGSSFAAKAVCSGVFVSGLPAERVWAEEVLPTSEAFDFISFDVDADRGEVHASAKGLGARTAIYRKGLGCTLAIGGAPETLAVPAQGDNFEPLSTRDLPENLTALLEKAIKGAFENDIDGGPPQTRAIVVFQDGDVVAERYADGVNASTPLKGWSMNKTLTGIAIGMVADRGWLNVEAPAPVPEWAEEDDPRGAITVRDLMTMSSGLEFLEDYSDLGSDVVTMLFDARSSAARAAAAPLGYEPGSYWYYSSGTTNILARIAGDALEGQGANLPVFMQKELFEPLGVSTAVTEVDSAGDFVGSSFGYMSAHDWARMGWFFLNEGRALDGRQLVSSDWLGFMTRDNGLSNGDYGAQIWLNRVGEDGRPLVEGVPEDMAMFLGHDGQLVAVIPSRDLVVVRLGETPTWSLEGGAGDLLRTAVGVADQIAMMEQPVVDAPPAVE